MKIKEFAALSWLLELPLGEQPWRRAGLKLNQVTIFQVLFT